MKPLAQLAVNIKYWINSNCNGCHCATVINHRTDVIQLLILSNVTLRRFILPLISLMLNTLLIYNELR